MSATQQPRDQRGKDDETIVEDELDTEGHRLSSNDNETIVVSPPRVEPTDGDDEPAPLDARRLRG
jgi:hypothetical protein